MKKYTAFLLFLLVAIPTFPERITVPASSLREPQGFLTSPYPLMRSMRVLFNHLSNGRFSYKNPYMLQSNLLPQAGTMSLGELAAEPEENLSFKMVFLGDFMLSVSGEAPQLSEELVQLIEAADFVFMNLESPIIESPDKLSRSLSLKFRMPIAYLQSICQLNTKGKWILSIANNHAFDTSLETDEDTSGLQTTVETIHNFIPNAEVVGADIGSALSFLRLPLGGGAHMGVIAWTDVMNNDQKHYKKPIVRGEDIFPDLIMDIRKEAQVDVLIGLPHGNEEQSYHPLSSTRLRWLDVLGPSQFDLIVGTGPHVILPAELAHERYIFHSIGNFFGPKGRTQAKIGWVVAMHLQNEGTHLFADYRAHFIKEKEEKIKLLPWGSMKPQMREPFSSFNVG